MKTLIKNTLFSFAALAVAFAGFAMTAQAQQPTVAQQYVTPQVLPQVMPQIQPQSEFYFGISVQLISNGYNKTLRIVSVTPGGPAQRAGLEIGDEIQSVNGQNFSYARDSFEAARMLSQFVSTSNVGGGPAPAVAATAAVGNQYYVPQPVASMVVRNVRNGQNVYVTVHPTRRFQGTPAPAVAAPAATSQLPAAGTR